MRVKDLGGDFARHLRLTALSFFVHQQGNPFLTPSLAAQLPHPVPPTADCSHLSASSCLPLCRSHSCSSSERSAGAGATDTTSVQRHAADSTWYRRGPCATVRTRQREAAHGAVGGGGDTGMEGSRGVSQRHSKASAALFTIASLHHSQQCKCCTACIASPRLRLEGSLLLCESRCSVCADALAAHLKCLVTSHFGVHLMLFWPAWLAVVSTPGAEGGSARVSASHGWRHGAWCAPLPLLLAWVPNAFTAFFPRGCFPQSPLVPTPRLRGCRAGMRGAWLPRHG